MDPQQRLLLKPGIGLRGGGAAIDGLRKSRISVYVGFNEYSTLSGSTTRKK